MRMVISTLMVMLVISGCQSPTTEIEISIPAGTPDIEIPFEVATDPLLKGDGLFETISAEGQNLLFQNAPSLFASDGMNLTRALCAVLPEGVKTTNGSLRKTTGNPLFKFSQIEGEKLKLMEGDKPIFVYNYGMQLPPGIPEDRRRSSYVHPVYDLNGAPITDDFPKDHYHHRGLSWMWPRVTIAGEQYNLWEISGIHHYFEKWLVQEVGPVCATLGVKNAWRLEDRKVADEWVLLRAFKTTTAGRAIDVCLTWQALEPIEILGAVKKGYGGLSFRFAPREVVQITTPTGLQEEDSNMQRVAWADESGKFVNIENIEGVAIFQHSQNPDFPEGWCLRHYGFLGVNWPGLEPFTLQPGVPVTLRFRLWIHNGNFTGGRVTAAYGAFSNPPQVKFVRK